MLKKLNGLLKNISCAAIFVSLLFITAARDSEAFVVVENGLPMCFIVLADNAHPAELFAARELADHVNKMTGAELPVRSMAYGDIPVAGRAIVLGSAGWQSDSRFDDTAEDMNRLGAQGYIMKSLAGDEDHAELLVLAGQSPRGTLYAVYDFLRQAGVRWYTPDFTYCPPLKSIDLGEVSVSDLPCFTYRDVSPTSATNDELWRLRLRLNCGKSFLEESLGLKEMYLPETVALDALLPSDLFAEDASLFPEIDGERREDTAGRCFSHPDAAIIAADSLAAYIERTDGCRLVRITLPDSSLCQCEDCRFLREQEGAESALAIQWLNEIADRLTGRYPALRIELDAVGAYEEAPKTMKPHRALMLRLAPDDLNQLRNYEDSVDTRTLEFVGNLRGWRRSAAAFIVSHPVGSHIYPSMPFPDMGQILSSLKVYHYEFAEGCLFRMPSLEGAPVADSECRTWLLAEMSWDRYRDSAALLKEWQGAVYGPADNAMSDYHEHVAELAQRPNLSVTVMTAPEEFIDPQWIDSADRILGRATAHALTDDSVRDRIKRERLGLDLVKLLTFLNNSGNVRKKSVEKSLERWEKGLGDYAIAQVSCSMTARALADSVRDRLK